MTSSPLEGIWLTSSPLKSVWRSQRILVEKPTGRRRIVINTNHYAFHLDYRAKDMQSNPRLPYTLRWLSVLFVTCMVMDQARGQSQLPGPQAAPQVPLASTFGNRG
ncbi:MAG: hypothetical protein U0905_10760 [Pirellulales bacterium]